MRRDLAIAACLYLVAFLGGCEAADFQGSARNSQDGSKDVPDGDEPKVEGHNPNDPRNDKGDDDKGDGDDNGDDALGSADDNGGDDALGGADDNGDDDVKLEVPDELQLDEIEFKCEKGQKGFVGKVYRLPPNTGALPDLDAMTPVGQVRATQLDVPVRKWKVGFPGIPDLIEWFAIKFFAVIDIPEDGAYQFKTHSDDGSKLYLGKDVVVNNDGTHSPTSRESALLTLKKGKRRIMVEWFQGPRQHIALQVYWKRPGASYEIIPAQVLTHGKDCNLQDIGTFE